MARLAETRNCGRSRQPIRLYFVALIRDVFLRRTVAVLAGDIHLLVAGCGPFEHLGHMTARAHTRLAEARGISGVLSLNGYDGE
jgi:hypothetical protein